MRLGADDIAVTVGDNLSVQLRPSLRAAFRLERRHDGFDKLIRGVADGQWSIILDVIAESSEPAVTDADLVAAIAGVPLKDVVPKLTEPVLRHVFALAGIDPDNPAQAKEGERVTFAEYHTKLFRLATGWLGWTPQESWKATPAEIEEAYSGRADMLRAIFGSTKNDEGLTSPLSHSDDDIAKGRATLKMMASNGGNLAVGRAN